MIWLFFICFRLYRRRWRPLVGVDRTCVPFRVTYLNFFFGLVSLQSLRLFSSISNSLFLYFIFCSFIDSFQNSFSSCCFKYIPMFSLCTSVYNSFFRYLGTAIFFYLPLVGTCDCLYRHDARR